MRYRVVDGRVEVTTAVPGGRATVDMYAGALLPEDVPAEQVAALLAAGRIAEVEVAVEDGPTDTKEEGRGDPGADPRSESTGPTNDEIREWARSTGRQVSDRGRIPASVLDEYRQAHGLSSEVG